MLSSSIILMETEHGDASLWGLIYVCALVMVSAGVCVSNLLVPTSPLAVVVPSRERRAGGDTEPYSVEIGRDGGRASNNGDDDGAVEIILRRGFSPMYCVAIS